MPWLKIADLSDNEFLCLCKRLSAVQSYYVNGEATRELTIATMQKVIEAFNLDPYEIIWYFNSLISDQSIANLEANLTAPNPPKKLDKIRIN